MRHIAVVGGVNYDIGAISHAPLISGDSNPGRVRTSLGGVGRNIAHNLRLMGMDVSLVTVFGDDRFGDTIREHAEGIGMDLSGSAVLPGESTSSYLYLAQPDGDMALAVSDMEIYRRMTPEFLESRLALINSAALCVVDANLPEESILYLAERCTVPILADPVSTVKAERLRRALGRLWCVKPNRMEAELLSGVAIRGEEDLPKAAKALLGTGLRRVCLSLSAAGCYFADASGEAVRLRPEKTDGMVNATGCGDAMTAAIAASSVRGLSLSETAATALRAAAIAARSYETISPAMCWESIQPAGGK
ncbi:MAG: PfkB family carbohydrate kinase [Oscillospiraceae bacterium]